MDLPLMIRNVTQTRPDFARRRWLRMVIITGLTVKFGTLTELLADQNFRNFPEHPKSLACLPPDTT